MSPEGDVGHSRTVALVTGAAGFIGCRLCEHLLANGDEVIGVDAFTDYYARHKKERNLLQLRGRAGFTFIEGDLNDIATPALLDGVRFVFHLAGQPGVRASWGVDFDRYLRHNVLATQRLLEACRDHPLSKFVYASSSSVYGEAGGAPLMESALPRPISPYGVTKLAGEQLCHTYQAAFSVPTVALRLFSVYGPCQRPDMAFARLVACAVHGGTFEIFGDGEQTRDWTFVHDVVNAMRAAAESEWQGVANIGGGCQVSMNDVVELLADLRGRVNIVRRPSSRGDVRHTAADISRARAAFGYMPTTMLRDGLRAMVEWECEQAMVTA
jgi:nucleoside-diphosphate-sugar epimerase